MNIRSEIGYCVWVIFHRRWGKTLINNKLRPQKWWEFNLREIINFPSLPCEYDWEPGIYDEQGNLLPLPPRYESD